MYVIKFYCREWGSFPDLCYWEHHHPGAGIHQCQERVSNHTFKVVHSNKLIILCAIYLYTQCCMKLVHRFRLGFLEQLEQWRLEMISKAHETVAGKVYTLWGTLSPGQLIVHCDSNLYCRVKRLTPNWTWGSTYMSHALQGLSKICITSVLVHEYA